MRRLVAMGVALGLAGAVLAGPASGGQQGYAQYPGSVKQGKRLTITVTNCMSGKGFDAVIDVALVDDDGEGEAAHEKRYDADPSGTTKIKVKIKKKRFQPAPYAGFTRCQHLFDGEEEEGTWWTDEDGFKVRKRKPSDAA